MFQENQGSQFFQDGIETKISVLRRQCKFSFETLILDSREYVVVQHMK